MKKADPKELERLVKESGLSYKQSGKSYIFRCPKCSKSDKLYIRKYDGRFVCWVCKDSSGFAGAPEYALTELLPLGIKEIKKRLYGESGGGSIASLDIVFEGFLDEDEDEELEIELPRERYHPYHHLPLWHRFADRGVKYLESRGIPTELAIEYDIRYSPEVRAVVFPVISGGILLGWQYRTVLPPVIQDGDEFSVVVKSWSSDDLPRETSLMFGDRITSDYAVLCEGPIDALKAHLVGGNVASMGKTLGTGQINRLLYSGVKRVYLAIDPDAYTEISGIIDKFGDAQCFKVSVPGGSDLGEMTLAEARDAVLAAEPALRGRIYLSL